MTEALDVRYFSPPEGSAVFEAETAEALPDNVLPFVRPAATATLAEPATGAAARFTSLLGGLARVLSAVSPVLFLASDVSEEERLKRQ
ncbi:MAG: hypothetical protein HYU99_10585, partial [Deltaproteobacteria bacterium]|nr:hypothetical protein [Deltaproteobacteria bacterium]